MSLSLTLQSHFISWWTLGGQFYLSCPPWNFLSECKSAVSCPATSSVLSHCSRTKCQASTQPQTLPDLAASCRLLSLQCLLHLHPQPGGPRFSSLCLPWATCSRAATLLLRKLFLPMTLCLILYPSTFRSFVIFVGKSLLLPQTMSPSY